MDTTSAEKILAGIWEEILGVTAGPDDDFFDLGGYSLLVVDVVDRARAAGLTIAAIDVFDHPTIATLAKAITSASSQVPAPGLRPDMVAHVWRTSLSPHDPAAPANLVPLLADGTGEPMFVLPLGTGHVRLATALMDKVRGGRPVYGFESVGYRAPVRPFLSVAETAGWYLAQLRERQPEGPYHLSGLCGGAVVALEMAHRLRDAGAEVASLVLLDLPGGMPELDPGWGLTEHFQYLLGVLKTRFGLNDPVADLPAVLAELKERVWFEETDELDDFYRLTVLWAAAACSQDHYEPRTYDGPVTVVVPAEYDQETRDYWGRFLPRADIRITPEITMVSILADPVTEQAFRDALG
ncbi:thioesterase domain-containing protein [Longispora albida]|uniref:thioesterase domain-containing protein n=1 Tax=Longispora albida TaxID=203523 RepID=UPI000360148C|nr:thioesterase domain-containing protein [Longispora albida]